MVQRCLNVSHGYLLSRRREHLQGFPHQPDPGHQPFQNHSGSRGRLANELENCCVAFSGAPQQKGGAKLMRKNGEAVMENVRRYRAIASLYRRTAAFRPLQSSSLLRQADEWEHLAMDELEAYFNLRDSAVYDMQPKISRRLDARWEMVAAA
jgi:hypothetical protein